MRNRNWVIIKPNPKKNWSPIVILQFNKEYEDPLLFSFTFFYPLKKWKNKLCVGGLRIEGQEQKNEMSMNKNISNPNEYLKFNWFNLLMKCNHMNLFVSVKTHDMKLYLNTLYTHTHTLYIYI